MINGDGPYEGFLEVASSDPLDSASAWRTQNVDGGSVASPISSRYSSCGDSEFERYCSANSAMGTPSMRSTITTFNDCSESEFGSARNFGFSDDGGLENFSLEGSERSLLDMNTVGYRKMELRDEVTMKGSSTKGSRGLNLYGTGELMDSVEANGEILCWKVESTLDLLRGVDMTNGSEKVESSEYEKEGSVVGKEASELGMVVDAVLGEPTGEEVRVGCLEESADENGMKLQQRLEECLLPGLVEKESDGELDMEDGTSRNEHSESEDSMYNFLSDGERKDKTFLLNNARSFPETNTVNENPLLINSSVAFGSDDWNVFECETQGYSLNYLTVDTFQERKHQNLNSSSMTVNGVPIVSEVAREDGTQMLLACKEDQASTNFLKKVNSSHGDCMIIPTVGRQKEIVQVRDIPVAICQVQASDELEEITNSTFLTEADFSDGVELDQDAKDIFVVNIQAGDTGKNTYNSECLVGDVTRIDMGTEEFSLKQQICAMDCNSVAQSQILETEDKSEMVNQGLESQGRGNLKVKFDPLTLSNILTNRVTHDSECCEDMTHTTFVPESKAHLLPVELAKHDLDDFYDEIVHEMEEILLESRGSPGARFTHRNKMSQSLSSLPLRDGGSTASISGTDSLDPINLENLKFDGVEVIGARQKRGDVSFSERLVGVKEYTVYKIRVWSGEKQWEVERRYRDFYSLYCQLKSSFADHGWTLPSPWSSIDNTSRKLFGSASPDIVAERSVLIQECLCSILHSRVSSTNQSALFRFLSPQESNSNSPAFGTAVSPSSDIERVTDTQNSSSLGKTIPLIVEIRPHKSTKQILELQHYACAGCYRHFDDQKTLMKGFVQSFGWGKPRLCAYTCQLFCSSCHTNEMAVIPARVLHHWDFARYPVSQLAKSYLDSIHDQPMLCVSAVNPSLFSKVPALLHVMGVRKKIGDMISYVRCPFRRSINRGLGSRRYLVESNDFFALRDLIDLSKGAFAALPTLLETVSRKILEHIEDKCLVCCDAGVSCGARQACNAPLSLIFPFQETEMERCASCESVFHKPCFAKLSKCSCGARLRLDETEGILRKVRHGLGTDAEESGTVISFLAKSTSISPLRSLSGLFGKSNQTTKEHKDNENIILMGSLPTTSL